MQQTHLETAAWRTRSPAPPVWVWTGWGPGSEHLAEPEKAMRGSDRAERTVLALAAQQYSTVINISVAVISSNSLNYESEFLLPSKEEQTLIWHRKTQPAVLKTRQGFYYQWRPYQQSTGGLLTSWQWHLERKKLILRYLWGFFTCFVLAKKSAI